MLTQRHRVTEKLIIPQYGEAIPVNSIYNKESLSFSLTPWLCVRRITGKRAEEFLLSFVRRWHFLRRQSLLALYPTCGKG